MSVTRRRRSSAGSTGSTTSATTAAAAEPATQSTASKSKPPMHVQFDLNLPAENSHQTPAASPKRSRAHLPLPHATEEADSSDKKAKRPSVIEQLKLSKNLTLSRENSNDSLRSASTNDAMTSSGRPDGPAAPVNVDLSRMSQEEAVKLALSEGLITSDDILRLAFKATKRKSSDSQSPLKAFANTDASGRRGDFLNDTDSSAKRDAVSKIPIYKHKAKHFDSSNESLDSVAATKDKPDAHSVRDVKSDIAQRRAQRRAAQRNEERAAHARRKRQDSSGSESCSPQASPCNTSSGMSLSGTTGSESSGAEQQHKKRSPPEITEYRARTRSLDVDLERLKKDKESVAFAAARKISLTRPNPPPIPPPSVVVKSSAFKESKTHEKSDNEETSQTLTPSQSNSQDSADTKTPTSPTLSSKQSEVFLLKPAASSPGVARKNAKGYTPSFHNSSKIVLRREASFDSVASDTPSTRIAGLRKVGSAPGIISATDENFQKIVQSDGSVVYKSYRKVSIDTMSDQDELEAGREAMNETYTVGLPGALPDDEEQPDVGRSPTPDAIVKRTFIDNDVSEPVDKNALKLILDNNDDDEHGERFDRGSRRRASHRSPRRRSKERPKERRSSSLGAVMRKLSQRKAASTNQEKAEDTEQKHVIKNKPPKPPSSVRSPSSGRSPVRGEDGEPRRPARRRTVSEQVRPTRVFFLLLVMLLQSQICIV